MMSELKVILKWVACSFMLSIASTLVLIPLSVLVFYEYGSMHFYRFIFAVWVTFFIAALVYLGAILTTSNISKGE